MKAMPRIFACLVAFGVVTACVIQPGIEQLVNSATEKCRQGQYDEAIGDVNLALERFKTLPESERATAGKLLVRLANGLESGRSPGPAHENTSSMATACRMSVSIRAVVQGPEDPAMEGPAVFVAAQAMRRADYAAAEPLWRHVVAIRERRKLPEDFNLANARAQLAVCSDAAGRVDESEKLFKEVLAYYDTAPLTEPAGHKMTLGVIADFYEKHGKFAEAAALRKKADAL